VLLAQTGGIAGKRHILRMYGMAAENGERSKQANAHRSHHDGNPWMEENARRPEGLAGE
jgi:hypothetical protein